jgi:hypothetical protein
MKRRISKLFGLSMLVLSSLLTRAQSDTVKSIVKSEGTTKLNWYDNIQIRGYLQVRYNRLLETNPDLKCEQCDKSWGENGGFFIRRARMIFSGQISKRVYFYVQPDFASSAGTTGHIVQLRDAYFDLGLDKDNQFRIRLGQSKVPKLYNMTCCSS